MIQEQPSARDVVLGFLIAIPLGLAGWYFIIKVILWFLTIPIRAKRTAVAIRKSMAEQQTTVTVPLDAIQINHEPEQQVARLTLPGFKFRDQESANRLAAKIESERHPVVKNRSGWFFIEVDA